MNSRLKDRVSCAGYYDYLDAILKTTNSGRSVRLFVDLDFRTQFEIARPTREYRALLELLPKRVRSCSERSVNVCLYALNALCIRR
jgi:uncharacterized protein (TIGR01615 family)